MKSSNKPNEMIPKMIKCRTCFEPADECTSINITKEYTLGKTIKDLLLLFIPNMITSPLVDEFICCKCSRRIRYFTNLIEKCLVVEKLLGEEISKAQQQIENDTVIVIEDNDDSESSNLVFVSLPTVNNEGVQNGFQPLQPVHVTAVPLNYFPNTTTATNQVGTPNVPQGEFILISDVKSLGESNPDSKASINNNNSKQTDTAEGIISSEEKKVNSENGNVTCTTCGEVFTRDDWSTVECSKCAGPEKEIELNFSDTPSDGPDNDDSEFVIESDPVILTTDSDKPSTNDILDSLSGAYQDTIISISQPSDKTDTFLEAICEKNVNIILHGPFNNGRKRMLLLGNVATQCTECKSLLTNPKELLVHFQKDHGTLELQGVEDDDEEEHKKTFQCPFCDHKETTALSLVDHLRQNHSIKNPFKCEKCGKRFKRRDQYFHHAKKFEKNPNCYLKKCRYCSELFTKLDYEEHLKDHKNVICDRCGRAFMSVHTFKMHYITHGDENMSDLRGKMEHLCPVCGKLLSNAQNWRLHLRTHGQRTRNYICDKCPKTFLTAGYLRSHLASTHGGQKFTCPICGVQVKTKTSLTSHHNLKHSESYLYTCRICGKNFNRSDYLRRHINRHTSKPPGPLCKKKYNYSVKMEAKPVQCKYCLKMFKNVYLLRTHLLSHVKSIRYKCKFCSMTFANPSTRLRHQKRHADPNFDLSCHICWKRMENHEKLAVHLARHNDTKKYECTHCEEQFCSKYHLRHHMVEKHTPQEEIEKEKELVLRGALKEFLLQDGV